MTSKTKHDEGVKMQCYQLSAENRLLQIQMDIYESHGSHKLKTYTMSAKNSIERNPNKTLKKTMNSKGKRSRGEKKE